ncbi:MAG: penicillin-binding transpeptidase domain-containing protein [Patescibacteria group bacterium]|nr:penicillin-binding transpeptidase domain-containing protein [Patescibacteria group bacterium]
MNRKLPLIHRGESGNMDFGARVRTTTSSAGIMYFFFTVVIVFFLIMIVRLFQLTVVKGNYYRSLSEDNRIREVVIEAQRGRILDRRGYVLAENNAVEVTESLQRQPSKRYYHDAAPFAHLLGYRQNANAAELQADRCLHKARLGDTVGKKGVEALFDCELRGRNGKKLIEVNAQGLFKRTLNVVKPVPGTDVQLSVDSDLQRRAYEMLQAKNKKGVVVAINPRNGEILTLTSFPSFDPQVFEDNDGKAIMALFQDKNRPLFNRATEGTYPPGSVFKPVIALAALEEGIIDRRTIVQDTGRIELGDRSFGTWNYLEHSRTEGDVDVIKSLSRSNDIFYYKISEKMGPDVMKRWSERFGFAKLTGIGIDEVAGTIPSPFWKQDTLKEQWYTGDSYNFSIGQGYVLSTPLQVTLAMVPFANGGRYCKPTLVKQGTPLASEPDCKPIKEITIEHLETIREGLLQACKVGGTGWPLFNFRIADKTKPSLTPPPATGSAALTPQPSPTTLPIEKLWDPAYLTATSPANLAYTKTVELGCKTGTAESMPGRKPHAWFTVFAPYEDPEILITVLFEEAGQGSEVAAPVARELLRLYFERVE